MARNEAGPAIWGIHAGRHGEAHRLFAVERQLALGWSQVGDLERLPPERAAFADYLAQRYPLARARTITAYTSVLFRFVHEMQVGDVVLYPAKQAREIYVGRVQSGYRFVAEAGAHYRHRRAVCWRRVVPRESVSDKLRWSLGASMTLFRVRRQIDEVMGL